MGDGLIYPAANEISQANCAILQLTNPRRKKTRGNWHPHPLAHPVLNLYGGR